MGRLEQYHCKIQGTPMARHSANQKIAGRVSEGERLQRVSEARRVQKQAKRFYLPVDEAYLAAKRERMARTG